VPGLLVRKEQMTVYAQIRSWLVPPVLVPLVLGLLIAVIAVNTW